MTAYDKICDLTAVWLEEHQVADQLALSLTAGTRFNLLIGVVDITVRGRKLIERSFDFSSCDKRQLSTEEFNRRYGEQNGRKVTSGFDGNISTLAPAKKGRITLHEPHRVVNDQT